MGGQTAVRDDGNATFTYLPKETSIFHQGYLNASLRMFLCTPNPSCPLSVAAPLASARVFSFWSKEYPPTMLACTLRPHTAAFRRGLLGRSGGLTAK